MCILNKNNVGFKKQFATIINGGQTEFVFHPFANKWFLLITQYGKVPNFYSVKFDVERKDGVPIGIQGPIDHPDFHISVPITITCNFGIDKDEIRAGIQYLVNRSKLKTCPTEIVVSLGLKEINGEILREVVKVLEAVL